MKEKQAENVEDALKLNREERKNNDIVGNITKQKTEIMNNVLENSNNIPGDLGTNDTKEELMKEKQAEDVKDGLLTQGDHYQESEESCQGINIEITQKLEKVREQMEISKKDMVQIEVSILYLISLVNYIMILSRGGESWF